MSNLASVIRFPERSTKSERPEDLLQSNRKGARIGKIKPGATLTPALRDFVDTCLVPILVKKYLAEGGATENDAA